MTADSPTTGDTAAPRPGPSWASLAQLLATEHRHTTRCWWDPTGCRWNCDADRAPPSPTGQSSPPRPST